MKMLPIAFLPFFALPLRAATITVDSAGGGDFAAIQPAIDAAKDGDTVVVKPGEYVITEPINFNRLHDPANPASPPVKNIVVKSEGGAEVTVIRMRDPKDPERASVAIFEHEESGASRLDGFTVTGGWGARCRTDESYLSGGGVMCRDGASPTLSRCTIRGNSAALSGGGVSCCNASPTIIDCTIAENSAESGGGLWVSYWSRPRVVRCLFAANGTMRSHGLVSATGAGLRSESLELNVEACVFTVNSASESGGGASISGVATFVNCLFTGNRAAHGGGFSCSFGRATLLNCTFHGNRATGDGGGILCAIESEVSFTGAIVWGDAAAQGNAIAVVDDQHGIAKVNVNMSDVEGGMAAIFAIPPDHVLWGEGNIDADPLFVVLGAWSDGGTPDEPSDDVWIPGDYHLQPGSPAIDAGTSEGAPSTDIEGSPRPQGSGVDIGAYESPYSAPGGRRLPGDANGDGGLDLSDAVAVLWYLFLGSPAKLPCGNGSVTDPANVKLLDWQPDSAVDISDAVAKLTFLFVGGKPHALAPEADAKGCVRIVGCSDLCGQ